MSSFGFETTGKEIIEHFKAQVKGKTIVITGASAGGLGAETARNLAHANPASIILLARSAAKVQAVIEEISETDPTIKTSFVPIELDKAESVRNAAQQVQAQVSQIDILINNAGIMATPYSKNVAGIESQFATNHVGHFIFTNLLMNKIKAAAPGARIVNLSSNGHKLGPVRFEDWNFSDGQAYDEWSGYGQAKTANILFSRYLAKHLEKDGIQSYAVHPGAITETGLADHMEWSLFEKCNEVSMRNTGHPFEIETFKTKQQGVSTTLRAALDPDLEKDTGAYLVDCQVEATREYATSDANATRLWQLSEKLVGQQYDL